MKHSNRMNPLLCRGRSLGGLLLVVVTAWLGRGGPSCPGQSFVTGSSGALRSLVVPGGTTNLISVPPDGILDYTDIRIGTNAQVFFLPNAQNTPVYLLATGDIEIAGTLNLDGEAGTSVAGGAGGPGGFDGGTPGFAGLPAGAGLGPGGGGEGLVPLYSRTNSAGSGAYASRSDPAYGRSGNRYGSSLLMPLLGGSGGGGGMNPPNSPGGGGGGGGGAILVASPTRIAIYGGGGIVARGGMGRTLAGHGSGGAIRLVAPRVAVARSASNVSLDASSPNGGGDGRIRIDSVLERGSIVLPALTTGVGSSTNVVLGSFLYTGITNAPGRFLLPRLDITRAAGQDIPEGTPAPVVVQLPFNGNPNQTVTVQASGFPVNVFTSPIAIQVAIIPESGPAAVFPALIDHRPGNGRGSVGVPVVIPLNTACHVQVWTAP